MRTVNEVSKLSGVSIRTLQYYDKIGLLHPTDHTEAGYRLYDDTALAKLQQILLFKELEFPLSEIKRILECADYDENKALSQQIRLLELKKERLERLIAFCLWNQTNRSETYGFFGFYDRTDSSICRRGKGSLGAYAAIQSVRGGGCQTKSK